VPGMAISTGDSIPDIELTTMGPEGPKKVSTGELLGTGKVVLFAVPGAFTPGCSKSHLPGFVEQGSDLKAKGIDTLACVSVNDAYVMDAWGREHGVGDDIVMLADGSAVFTEAMGLVFDMTGFGMGKRSKRYAAVIEDGVITQLEVDDSGAVDKSSCSNILSLIG
jgi:peroxiredoxin